MTNLRIQPKGLKEAVPFCLEIFHTACRPPYFCDGTTVSLRYVADNLSK